MKRLLCSFFLERNERHLAQPSAKDISKREASPPLRSLLPRSCAHREGTKFNLKQTYIRTTDGNDGEQFRLHKQWDAHRGSSISRGTNGRFAGGVQSFAKVRTSRPETANYSNG